jgi:hypothetical protein
VSTEIIIAEGEVSASSDPSPPVAEASAEEIATIVTEEIAPVVEAVAEQEQVTEIVAEIVSWQEKRVVGLELAMSETSLIMVQLGERMTALEAAISDLQMSNRVTVSEPSISPDSPETPETVPVEVTVEMLPSVVEENPVVETQPRTKKHRLL